VLTAGMRAPSSVNQHVAAASRHSDSAAAGGKFNVLMRAWCTTKMLLLALLPPSSQQREGLPERLPALGLRSSNTGSGIEESFTCSHRSSNKQPTQSTSKTKGGEEASEETYR